MRLLQRQFEREQLGREFDGLSDSLDAVVVCEDMQMQQFLLIADFLEDRFQPLGFNPVLLQVYAEAFDSEALVQKLRQCLAVGLGQLAFLEGEIDVLELVGYGDPRSDNLFEKPGKRHLVHVDVERLQRVKGCHHLIEQLQIVQKVLIIRNSLRLASVIYDQRLDIAELLLFDQLRQRFRVIAIDHLGRVVLGA